MPARVVLTFLVVDMMLWLMMVVVESVWLGLAWLGLHTQEGSQKKTAACLSVLYVCICCMRVLAHFFRGVYVYVCVVFS